MIRFARSLAFATALALTAAVPAAAQDFSTAQRGEIEKIIKDYLIKHPEVLQEAMGELRKRQELEESEKVKLVVKENADTLFNSPRQVTIGNPRGDVTFVEFFDYNCGFCKNALADVLDLLKTDSNLKIVLKELPVLSRGSFEAAQVAVAVRMQDPTGKKYLEFHQKLMAARGQADRAKAVAVAKEIGLDMARLDKDLKSEEVEKTLAENKKLSELLNISGTPSFVVGENVLIGAVGIQTLRSAIQATRNN